jgi:hypothetical protein
VCDGTPGDTFNYELVSLPPKSKRNLNGVAREEWQLIWTQTNCRYSWSVAPIHSAHHLSHHNATGLPLLQLKGNCFIFLTTTQMWTQRTTVKLKPAAEYLDSLSKLVKAVFALTSTAWLPVACTRTSQPANSRLNRASNLHAAKTSSESS